MAPRPEVKWTFLATMVSPSPIELFARLEDHEKVAIDRIQEHLPADGVFSDVVFAALGADATLVALVPEEKRRGYLRTLAVQLRALGFSLAVDPALDESVALWASAKARYLEAQAARQQAREAEAARERLRLEALPAAVRRAVERRRRRQARRQRG